MGKASLMVQLSLNFKLHPTAYSSETNYSLVEFIVNCKQRTEIIVKADSMHWLEQQRINSKTCIEVPLMIIIRVVLAAEANAILTLIIIR